jgi:hypothetical protein
VTKDLHVLVILKCNYCIWYSNMTSFKRFETKPVVKIIYTYTHCDLWRHRQFISIFYQFLHIRIEIIHGSHMHMLFLPRVGLYVNFVPLAYARGKTHFILIKPVFSDHLCYVTLFQCSLGKSHKTGLTVSSNFSCKRFFFPICCRSLNSNCDLRNI